MVIVCAYFCWFFLFFVVTFFVRLPGSYQLLFFPSSLHYFYYIYLVYPYALLHHHHHRRRCRCFRCRCRRRRRVMRPNVLLLLLLLLLSMCMVCLFCFVATRTIYSIYHVRIYFCTTNRQSLLYGCVVFSFFLSFLFHLNVKFKWNEVVGKKEIDTHRHWHWHCKQEKTRARTHDTQYWQKEKWTNEE